MSPHHKEKERCEKCFCSKDELPNCSTLVNCPCHQEKPLVTQEVDSKHSIVLGHQAPIPVEEWEEDFDQRFCAVEGHETIKTFLNPRDIAIKAFIASTLQAYKDSLREEMKRMVKKTHQKYMELNVKKPENMAENVSSQT